MWDDLLRHTVTNYIEKELLISTNVTLYDGFSWWISAIYGPAKRKDRNRFMNEINSLYPTCSPNWLIEGDFNIV